MKQLIFSALFCLCLGSILHAQQNLPVKFKTTVYSFGKIKQGVPATTQFTFINTSSKPMVVEVATAECGCTSPEYPKKPVMKNEEGAITVTYNAAALGHFEKSVTVKFANIAEPIVLKIEGEVVK